MILGIYKLQDWIRYPECMTDDCDEVVFINVFNNENAYVVLSTYGDFGKKLKTMN